MKLFALTTLVVSGVALSALGGAAALGGATTPTAPIRQGQVLELERTGIASPRGLAFAPASGRFYAVDAASARGAQPGSLDVVQLAPFELRPESDRVASTRLTAAVRNPLNMVFDFERNRLLFLVGNSAQLLEVHVGADGAPDANAVRHHDARALALQDARGMAVAPASGTLFVLDAKQPRIVRVQFAPDGGLDAATISQIDLRGNGLLDPRGLAFDPTNQHLYVADAARLYEFTSGGELASARDLSGVEVADPQGMVFAPSADQTDAPTATSLWLADAGGGAGSGAVVELSLTPVPTAASATFSSSVVRTTNTAAWNPSSPDPSGIAYVTTARRLMVSDAEVEETVNGITHFKGRNVWETSLSGSVLRTANISKVAPTVVPMANEPTGVAFDPSSRTYYFSDDNAKKVFHLNPGGDGLVGTADDTWTSFGTGAVGDGDPEGIAYDPATGTVFVSDGVNAEIYAYTRTGSLLRHFDVLRYGVADPESVEFNPASGTLCTLSNRKSGPIVVRTTTSGALLQTIDVSAMTGAGGRKPAGIAVAPASNGSGAMRFYVVDRGIDNNSVPTENDGKMFELTSPLTG